MLLPSTVLTLVYLHYTYRTDVASLGYVVESDRPFVGKSNKLFHVPSYTVMQGVTNLQTNIRCYSYIHRLPSQITSIYAW